VQHLEEMGSIQGILRRGNLSRDPSGVWGGSEIRGNIARRELLGASVGER
jgi:hypothetical protein